MWGTAAAVPIRGRSLGSVGRPRATAATEPVVLPPPQSLRPMSPTVRDYWEGGGTVAICGGGAIPAASSGASPSSEPRRSLAVERAAAAVAGLGSGRHSASPAPRRKLPTEVEQMAAALEQRVMQVSQAEGARLRMFTDQAQRLLEGLHAMRVAREIQEERRQKELRMLENNVSLDLHKAIQDRKEMEARLEDRGSKCLAEMKEGLRAMRLQRDTECEDYSRNISEEVYRIHGILEEQRTARIQYGERIEASLEVEFKNVHEAILAEQKLRFEAEGTMLRMVEDVCSRMRGEIRQERDQREAVQGKLLGLLEETCNRIEASCSYIQPAEPGVFC